MFRIVFGASIALVSAAAALAQGVPNVMPGGVPPAVLGSVVAAHVKARNESLHLLSADHREKIRGIVDAFNQGAIASARDAAAQIDAVLSPSETRAILAERLQMRVALQRAGGLAAPARAGSPQQTGAATGFAGGASGGMRGGDRPDIDAGRFLLVIDANPNALAAARRHDRPVTKMASSN